MATPEAPPSARWRLAFALAIGALSAAFVVAYARGNPAFISDFDQVWAGARALLHGDDPYTAVGPTAPFRWHWPLYYPLPALLLMTPLALLPVIAARAAFAGLTTALFAWAATRDGWYRWPAFISISFFVTIQLVQWSALFAAALLLPLLSWAAITKPNLGIAVVTAIEDDRAVWALAIGALALITVSLIVQPSWPREWFALVRSASHFRAPVTRPWGLLMLVALIRYRRPDARFLLALACIPQTPGFYDPLFLFALMRTVRESLILCALSFVGFIVMAIKAPFPNPAQWMDTLQTTTIVVLYLPTVLIVIRRPNEGTVPRIVQRAVAALGIGRRRPA